MYVRSTFQSFYEGIIIKDKSDNKIRYAEIKSSDSANSPTYKKCKGI
jgi:hypothetical protein